MFKIACKKISRFTLVSLCIGGLFTSSVPAAKAASYNFNNPFTNACGGTTWHSLYFGNYYQSDKTGKKKDPIQWRILSVQGSTAYLISDKNLDTQPYNNTATDTTWENSSIRKWLNGKFLNEAFTKQEQQAIISNTVSNESNAFFKTAGGNQTTDKVLLPSLSDMQNAAYGFNTEIQINNNARKALNTDYLASKTGMNSSPKGDCYWLRTPGYLPTHATRMNENGYGDIYGMAVSSTRYAVRPVIRLNLDYYRYWKRGADITSLNDVKYTEPQKKATQIKAIKTPKRTRITKVKINKTKAQIKLHYKKISKVSGYEIEYAASRSFRNAKNLDTDRTYVKIKKLKRNKKYYVRVRSYLTNADDTVTKYSKWSKVKKVYIK